MKKQTWLFAATLIGSAPAVQAQGYIGFGFGTTSADIQADAEAAFADLGVPCDDPTLSCSFDEDDSGFKVFGGNRLTPNFAVEAFYVDLGEATGSVTGPGGTFSFVAEASAFGAAAVGLVPVTGSVELLAKVGLARWSADVTASLTGSGSASEDDDGTDPFFGLGAQWNADGLSLRGEFERFDLDGTDVDLLSVSAIFNF